MKVNELIQKLQSFDQNLDVIVMDLNLNSKHDDSEGSSEGVYPEFDVEVLQSTTNQDFLSITCNYSVAEPLTN